MAMAMVQALAVASPARATTAGGESEVVSVPPSLPPATLTGDLANDTVYFIERRRIRHHRYSLRLRQKASITERLQTVADARLRFDAALYPHGSAPGAELPRGVRRDEMAEGEFRELYADWLGDLVRAKIGLQRLDWFETLTTVNSGLVTPLDLRHGGFGDADELIVPQVAVAANHVVPFGSGSLGAWEWVVARPESHRLAAGANGYATSAEDLASLDAREEPLNIKDAEFGWRWLASVGSLELTGLAYHGHERLPRVHLETMVSATGAVSDVVEGERIHPRVNTYAGFMTYAADAWVARGSLVVQPSRERDSMAVRSPFGAPVGSAAAADGDDEAARASLIRVGAGFDYVDSKHLKAYSEAFYTRHDYRGRATGMTDGDPEDHDHDDEMVYDLRLVNESYQGLKITLDGAWYAPRRAAFIGPEIEKTWSGAWRAGFGARFLRSYDDSSPLAPLKDASHVWASLAWSFDAATVLLPGSARAKGDEDTGTGAKKSLKKKKKKKRSQ